MLRLLGAVLLTGGAGALGFGAAARLNRRVHVLRLFTEALERMERELSFRLTSIPELFALLSDQLSLPVGIFFARCRGNLFRLGEERLEDLWRNTLAESDLELEPEEQQILETLGGILGRYDGEGQTQALALARAQLEQCLEAAVAERNKMGKVYGALGLAAGAFLVIVLL